MSCAYSSIFIGNLLFLPKSFAKKKKFCKDVNELGARRKKKREGKRDLGDYAGETIN